MSKHAFIRNICGIPGRQRLISPAWLTMVHVYMCCMCRDTDPLKPTAGSLADSLKGDSDDDEESLNEYGDIDPTKFNEDGSFVEDYRTEQRNRRPMDSFA